MTTTEIRKMYYSTTTFIAREQKINIVDLSDRLPRDKEIK